MSQPAKPVSRFRTFLKWTGIALLLTAVVWAGIIVWWQVTHRVVSAADVLLYLVVLPLLLILGIGAIQLVRAIAFRKTTNQLEKPEEKSSQDSADEAAPHAIEKKLKLPVVGAWAVTSVGQNADEFVQALIEKRSRPRPDSFLLDERGFPLLSGRVQELDIQPIQTELEDIAIRNNMNNVPASDEWRDAFLRTIALLSQVIDKAKDEWPLEFSSDEAVRENQPIATLRGNVRTHADKRHGPSLQVKLLIPADFKPHEKQLSLAYLLEKISALGVPDKQLHVEVVPSSDDATALSLIDKFTVQAHRNGASEALLLLASHSMLCTTIVEEWQSSGQLFSSHCPAGLMMGEAAFCVLCLSNKALEETRLAPLCQVTRTAFDKRESSADQPGKPSHACLTAAANDALSGVGLAGEQIGAIACDADHRTSRTLECIGAMMNITPHLDAIENRLATNEACGHLGIASLLGAFVAGATHARNDNQPVLLFNVSHVMERAAAVLLPSDDTPQAA
jgi:hypothetical protein